MSTKVEALNDQNKPTVTLNGAAGSISAGGEGVTGTLVTKVSTGTEIIKLGVAAANEPAFPGGPPVPEVGGLLALKSLSGKDRLLLNGATGDIFLGGAGVDGDVYVADRAGKPNIHADGQTSRITLGAGGQLAILDTAGKVAASLTSVESQGLPATGELNLGGKGNSGLVNVMSSSGEQGVILNGENAIVRVGRRGRRGSLLLLDDGEQPTIMLDGQAGDITLFNADCAEEFDVDPEADLQPGAVMVMNDDGTLRPCRKAYDTRVAGVLSGAGGFKPALLLDRSTGQKNRRAIALAGKVYCWIDARHEWIAAGDLLTTSSHPGHAMKVTDPTRAFGAVIGKALRGASGVIELIPILVSLQ